MRYYFSRHSSRLLKSHMYGVDTSFFWVPLLGIIHGWWSLRSMREIKRNMCIFCLPVYVDSCFDMVDD